MIYERWNGDLFYGAFFFYGVVTLGSSLLPFLPVDNETGRFLGSAVLFPLHALSVIALVIGIAFACRLLRDWKVAALIVALVADWGIFFVLQAYDLHIDLMIAASIIYALITCAFSVVWFLSDRNPKYESSVRA
jgi:hypothetical protein